MMAALVQSNPRTGDLRGNMEFLVAAVKRAAAADAELCLAPEMALCGPNAGDLLLRAGFAEECREVLNAAALGLAEGRNPPLLLGAPVSNPVPTGKSLQSGAVLLHEGRVRVLGRKILLPSGGIHDEAGYFEPGVACGVLLFKGWRFCVTLGEDAWNEESAHIGRRLFSRDPVADFFSAGGADCLINLCARPYEQGGIAPHEQMLARLAERYRIPVLAANMVGGNDSLVYYGGSLALDNLGRHNGRAGYFAEELLLADLSGKRPAVRLDPVKGEAAPCPEGQRPTGEEELWLAVVLGLGDFVRKCGFRRALLGLSGGADSALVAALAAEALGPENVAALLMPASGFGEDGLEDTLALASNLGISAHVLPVSPLPDAFERLFGQNFTGGLSGFPRDNILARIRGALLMAYANRFDAMLLSTVDKSETAIGRATLYGDLCGAISPIGDLYKDQVRSLCRHYNRKRPGAIPGAILQKTPSTEGTLRREDGAPLSSAALDPLIRDILEGRENLRGLIRRGHDPAAARQAEILVRKSEFKRRQSPPVLHLTARGGGMRIPVAAV
ncbi:MAG: NAD(+) synthase [Desulfovibrio sp.]|jgi:NAD+ synthase (glutamine-hydrolysing)|nr:NAD(+) synthase [Desulfovibrio sp.]